MSSQQEKTDARLARLVDQESSGDESPVKYITEDEAESPKAPPARSPRKEAQAEGQPEEFDPRPTQVTQDQPQRKEPKAPPLQWSSLKDINSQWFSAIGKEVAMDKLAWDSRVEFGQARPLDDQHVLKIVESMRLRPPREPIKVTLWENQADKKYYILSGQHVSKAVFKIREERERERDSHSNGGTSS